MIDVYGASSGGLMTMEQPAASAGAPAMPKKPVGPLDATNTATTPYGSGFV